jgi:hypothetical protein
VLIKENAKMRELQRGTRKDAMIPTGSNVVEAEEVAAAATASQESVKIVNTPSTIDTEGCSLAPVIFKNGAAPAYQYQLVREKLA